MYSLFFSHYCSHEPYHFGTFNSHSKNAIPPTAQPQPSEQHPVLFAALVHIELVYVSIETTKNPVAPCLNQCHTDYQGEPVARIHVDVPVRLPSLSDAAAPSYFEAEVLLSWDEISI